MIKKTFLYIFPLLLLLSCGQRKSTLSNEEIIPIDIKPRKTRFTGNYNKEFNDLHPLHIGEAMKSGIIPLALRADTIHQMKKIVRLPDELELYKSYDITHSIPYLVPSATKLFIDIAQNFRDSLVSKDLPLYKIYLTSVTRTDEDIKLLTKRNINASHDSAHRYATTFDISWKRFAKLDKDGYDELAPERLKLVLAQVLFDLKDKNRCYVKHERKQACFHITVRE